MNSQSSAIRTAMPHVVSQWQSDHFPGREMEYRRSTQLEKATTTEFLRPDQISIRRSTRAGGVRPTPSLKLLAARDNERWEYQSGRGDWEQTAWEQSGGGRTPSTSVESVFEMYSSNSYESPNSSINSSSFIAELEDTALVTRPSRRSAPPSSNKMVYISPSSMEFQTSDLSARAVIKVVDETIAAIEDSNRKLLSRAVAAEEAAKALMEQNSELQLKIERCNRRTRARTAPSSPVSRTRKKRNQDPDDATPLSVFNATFDQPIATPRPVKNRSQSAPDRPPPYPDLQSSLWPQTPLSAPVQTELMPSPFNNSANHRSFPIQRQEQQPSSYYRRPPSLPTTPQPPQFQSPPQPQVQSQAQSQLLSPFRSPGIQPPLRPPPLLVHREIAPYKTHHILTPAASTPHLRSHSLETQFKNKPLPPLGPMSPSVLSGLVEIGATNGVDEWGRAVKSDGGGRRRKGLSSLFKKTKESPIWK
ncbi:hypothetical protein BKA64DRAFT_62035 [Cadophora sp. MPI-SDFR-AT-0126]|nr:hypothetical protein BKA64DRAFT_62035 [Leotiomycetes sp. MPI-SDFR-AT-0126]